MGPSAPAATPEPSSAAPVGSRRSSASTATPSPLPSPATASPRPLATAFPVTRQSPSCDPTFDVWAPRSPRLATGGLRPRPPPSPPPPPPPPAPPPPLTPVDSVLLDVGVSSMQLDDPDRGFSFRRDGPLDMRMDSSTDTGGITAMDVVNGWPEDALAAAFRDLGEDRGWRKLASNLAAARATAPITTTHGLVRALGLPVVAGGRGGRGGKGRGGRPHPATRAFQAIRLCVNDELGALEAALPAAVGALRPGGRLGVITFHSLEDRLVKRAFLRLSVAGGVVDGDGDDLWRPGGTDETGGGTRVGTGSAVEGRAALELRAARAERAAERAERGGAGSAAGAPGAADPPPPLVRIVTRRPIVADEDETRANPRSRTAKLRVVERLNDDGTAVGGDEVDGGGGRDRGGAWYLRRGPKRKNHRGERGGKEER